MTKLLQALAELVIQPWFILIMIMNYLKRKLR